MVLFGTNDQIWIQEIVCSIEISEIVGVEHGISSGELRENTNTRFSVETTSFIHNARW